MQFGAPATVPGLSIPVAVPGGPKLCHLLSDEALLRKLLPNSQSEDCVSALRALNLPDSFWTDEFKVVPCAKTYSHKWTLCPCAHAGETARRRDPKTVAYKAVLCPLVKAKKPCPLGDACSYAHNVFEHWLHPSRYKTRLCSFGRNCNRAICFFAHSADELRCVPSSEDVKDSEERDYLLHLLMAQESGLLPSSALQQLQGAGSGLSMSMSMPVPGMMSSADFGSALKALQTAGSGRLPPSGRASLSGVPDPSSVLMSGRQSLSGVNMSMPDPSGMLSGRPSMTGIPDPAAAALLSRASLSGLMDPNLADGLLMHHQGRASMPGIPDPSGIMAAGMADPAMLLSVQQSMQQSMHQSMQHSMSMERALSRELGSSFSAMQRALSSDLGSASNAAAAATSAMERAFSSAAALGMEHVLASRDQLAAAAAAMSPMHSHAMAGMERAMSRDLGHAQQLPPPPPQQQQQQHHNHHQHQAHQQAAAYQQHMQMQQQQQQQQQMHGDGGTSSNSGSLDRSLSHSRSLGSGAIDRALLHNPSVTSVESDSLVQLRAGGSSSATAAATSGHSRASAFDPSANHQPPRLSDPGTTYLAHGTAPGHNRASDSGNTLGLLTSKDLGPLESLLPLVNTALATGQLAMPSSGSASSSQQPPRRGLVHRSSSSSTSGQQHTAGVLSPVQAASPTHSAGGSGSGSPPSPTAGSEDLPPGSGGGALSPDVAALDAQLRAAAAAVASRGQAGAGGKAPGAPAVAGVSPGALGDLVARLQDQGVNREQLVSSLSQLLAQLLSVDG